MEELEQYLKKVRELLQKSSHIHTTAVTVRFTEEGYTIERELRSPGSLKRAGISMRNLRGEWIE